VGGTVAINMKIVPEPDFPNYWLSLQA